MDNVTLLVFGIAIFFAIVIIVLIGLLVVNIIYNIKFKQKEAERMIYQAHISAIISKDIIDILNCIIDDCFKDYQVKYLVPKYNNSYISEEAEAEIRRDLVELVTSRISDAAMDKISLFYNKRNIARIIGDKIYIAVTNYVVENNSHYEN